MKILLVISIHLTNKLLYKIDKVVTYVDDECWFFSQSLRILILGFLERVVKKIQPPPSPIALNSFLSLYSEVSPQIFNFILKSPSPHLRFTHVIILRISSRIAS